jgi:hypothetical protein
MGKFIICIKTMIKILFSKVINQLYNITLGGTVNFNFKKTIKVFANT